jgi:hypothetical protein
VPIFVVIVGFKGVVDWIGVGKARFFAVAAASTLSTTNQAPKTIFLLHRIDLIILTFSKEICIKIIISHLHNCVLREDICCVARHNCKNEIFLVDLLTLCFYHIYQCSSFKYIRIVLQPRDCNEHRCMKIAQIVLGPAGTGKVKFQIDVF